MANLNNVDQLHKELEIGWMAKMTEFENRLKDALVPASTSNNPTLQQLNQDFCAFKESVSNMLGLLQQQVRSCSYALDEMETRHRQKILLLNGISEDPNSNVEQQVLDIFHNKLGLTNMIRSSIKRCHRLGPLDRDRCRAVLVHFCDYSVKRQVWKSKSKLENTPFTMSEFLTRMRQSIHKMARKHFGMRNVWTLDGRIYIKLPDGSRKKISTEEDFSALVTAWTPVLVVHSSEMCLPSGAHLKPVASKKWRGVNKKHPP
ncbi:unnamed protein product, partial [Iphiclides podalirius]